MQSRIIRKQTNKLCNDGSICQSHRKKYRRNYKMNEEKIEVVEEIDIENFELMHDGKGEDDDE